MILQSHKKPDLQVDENCEKDLMHRLFRTPYVLLWLLSASLLFSCSDLQNPNNYVDVFIGTGGHGHTFPGAAVPFGMIQPGPVNGTPGWDWVSGYHYSDSVITGFTQTHLSGTGIGDLNDLLIQPVPQSYQLKATSSYEGKRNYASRFSHDYEKAEPGYYSVLLQDSDINAEMTATDRVAMYRFTYPFGQMKSLILDLGYSLNWDTVDSVSMQQHDSRTFTGYRMSSGWAKDQYIYFAMTFSQDIEGIQSCVNSNCQADLHEGTLDDLLTRLDFANDGEELLVKMAYSAVSEEGALLNLRTLQGWDFEEVKILAAIRWQKELDTIKVKGDKETKTKFYTALYHTKLAPALYSDADHSYRGANGRIYKDSSFTRYTIFSLWDTFRAQHPLLTITNPDRVFDMTYTMMEFYEETGLLPVWELHSNETNTMTGYHAIPVLLDAFQKGLVSHYADEVLEAMKASAMQDQRDTDLYREYGYIPTDLGVESVTKTLEYAYDDWCIAQMAKLAERESDYNYFMQRSRYWQNVWDESTFFMRGKTSAGEWASPFDPFRSTHRHSTDYTEGNAWQHTWFVPHQVHDLIGRMGGDQSFINRLDSLFELPSVLTGEDVSPDISGMIGQYAHGNEPSHHIAYLYNYAGAAWKTQFRVAQVMDSLYTVQPDGLSGNEDVGQMSAWYVFSALGFYPVNPADGRYVIGTPHFKESEIKVGEGKTFTIIAENKTAENIYIQEALLNGQILQRSYITHNELIKGGILIFKMGNEPNTNWASGIHERP